MAIIYRSLDSFLVKNHFSKVPSSHPVYLSSSFFNRLPFLSVLHEGEENIQDDGVFEVKTIFLPCCLTVQQLLNDSCLFLYLLLVFSLCWGAKCVAAFICVEQMGAEF